jgi:hypothetical protein
MKIEICTRRTNEIMHTSNDFETIKDFVVALISKGADLWDANLRDADLWDARGVYFFGGIGNSNRTGYAWMENGVVVFGLGCHFGNKKVTIAAIQTKYGKGTTYEAQIELAEKIMLEKYAEVTK